MTIALSLFQENGYENTTMRDIAREAGIALGSAYYYFASKDELVAALYLQTLDESESHITSVCASFPDLNGRLRTHILWHFDALRPLRPMLHVLLAQLLFASSDSASVSAIRTSTQGLFERLLDGVHIPIHTEVQRNLAELLWLFWIVVLIVWVRDGSTHQNRTRAFLDASLELLLGALMFLAPVGFPLRPAISSLVHLFQSKGE